MLYPVGSALVSGIAMYTLGHTNGKGTESTSKTTLVEGPASFARAKHSNHTFTDDTITPIIRKIKMNQYCNITYSTLHKAPLAVHEILDKNLINGTAKRDDNFHEEKDQSLPKKFKVNDKDYYNKCKIYANFDYDRGHMAGASNYDSKQELKSSTFTFANTVPQNKYNNRGIWNTFQRYTRSLLNDDKCETVEVVSGPIFYSDIPYHKKQPVSNDSKATTEQKTSKNSNEKEVSPPIYRNQQIVFGENGIITPPQLYKIIKCNTRNGYSYVSGFKFKNERTYDNKRTLESFRVSIDQIENKTGLIFNFDSQGSVIGELVEYDVKGTSKTKEDYDMSFFTQLFESKTDIKGMNGILSRAYSDNQIRLDPKPYYERIDEIAEKELNEMNNPQYTSCRNLFNVLRFSQNLYYLKNKSYEPFTEKISNEIENKIIDCKNEDDMGYKKIISDRIYRGGKYQYMFQDQLREAIPEIKKQKKNKN